MEKVSQILLVEQEVQGDERSVLETILDTDAVRSGLLKEEAKLMTSTKPEDEERLIEVYKELQAIDADKSVIKAKTLRADRLRETPLA